MPAPPTAPSSKDAEHLRLLTVFHYVLAGLSVLGIGILCLHFVVMHAIFANPEIWKNSKNPPPPELFAIFKWVYLFGGAFLVTAGTLNVLSAFFLRKRRHRMFSLVVTGLNCLQIPFGTVLGVFTIVVLSRESVRETYAQLKTDDGGR